MTSPLIGYMRLTLPLVDTLNRTLLLMNDQIYCVEALNGDQAKSIVYCGHGTTFHVMETPEEILKILEDSYA